MRISPEEIEHYARRYRQRVAAGLELNGRFESWLASQMALKAQGDNMATSTKQVEVLVLHALQFHIGASNGVHIRELVHEVFNQTYREGLARQIRNAIQVLRNEGQHICGTPKAGYYIAANAEELESTCEFLHKRAMSTLTQVRAMRSQPLRELAGQRRLPS